MTAKAATVAWTPVFKSLQASLISKGVKSIATGQCSYFRDVIAFRGCKSPTVQAIFKEHKSEIKALSPSDSIELAFELIKSKYAEEKQFGVMVLHENVKHIKPNTHVKLLENIIDSHVYDWGTSDNLAGRVLFYLLKSEHGKAFTKTLVTWKDSSHLWRQRISCVSFVKIARFGNHTNEIIEICTTCVKNPERFVQLGVGWVLRELSLANYDLVIKFIKSNYSSFSREGLRYAIEKMKETDRKALLKYMPSGESESETEEQGQHEEEEEEVEEQDDDEEDFEPKKTSKRKGNTTPTAKKSGKRVKN